MDSIKRLQEHTNAAWGPFADDPTDQIPGNAFHFGTVFQSVESEASSISGDAIPSVFNGGNFNPPKEV